MCSFIGRIGGYMAVARSWVEDLLPDREEGQGMAEYALIIALISIAAIALLFLFKAPLTALFSQAQSALAGAT